jgi:hypothetical protein
MSGDEGLRIVGTIRSIELCSITSRFQGIPSRQVAKIQIDIERALDGDGAELAIENLADIQFQGPPELVPRFSQGERVQITTTAPSGMHIATIRPAPLS